MNNNVFNPGQFNSWNNKFGNNFTDKASEERQIGMAQQNMITGGAYQAEVSGAYGEFTLSTVLSSLPKTFHVMNDILLDQGIKYRPYKPEMYGESPFKVVKINNRYFEAVQRSTQIDHIIVSNFGVYVIETKNHKGYVFGDVNGAIWTQTLLGGHNQGAYNGVDHYKFYNPVKQNLGHINELHKQIHLKPDFMIGMIAFTNPEAYLGNVNCNCCYTLDMLYSTFSMISNSSMTISDSTVESIIHRIEHVDTNNYSNAEIHKAYVQDIQHRHEINKLFHLRSGRQ